MKKRVIFAIAVCTLLFIFTVYSLFFDNNDTEVRQYGKKMVEAYTAQLETRVAKELEQLFHELDEDKDGVLTLNEFVDRRLAVAAAMNAARREFADNVPQIGFPVTTKAQIFSFLGMWIQAQFLFLLVLAIYENVVYMVFDSKPRVLKLDDSYFDANPKKVDIASAFRYDTPVTLYERIKMGFFIVSGIAFLRLVLTVVFLMLALIIINIAVTGGRSRRKNPVWFSVCDSGVQLCGNIVMFALGFYCVRVYGDVAKPEEAKILIGNHVCVLEVVILFLQAHMPSFVSRVENLSVPLFRGVATATNSILVNRDASASRQQTLEAIKSRAGDPKGDQLMLFPEGTTNSQRALFLFKKGAFEAGEPVSMACFAFPYKHFNMCWSGRMVGGNDIMDLMLRMVCQFVNHAEVRFLPAYYPSEEEKKDSELYANHCQKMIAHVVDLPVSDAQFKDYKLAEKIYSRRKHDNDRWTYIDPSVESPASGNTPQQQQRPQFATSSPSVGGDAENDALNNQKDTTSRNVRSGDETPEAVSTRGGSSTPPSSSPAAVAAVSTMVFSHQDSSKKHLE